MFRPLRTLVSIAFIALMVWCSFRVPLGTKTFAEHMDGIGRTEEAKALLEGTRSTVSPAVEEMTERMLGEYIEAPTAPGTEPPKPSKASSRAKAGPPGRAEPKAKAKLAEQAGPPSTSERVKLPGRPTAIGVAP